MTRALVFGAGGVGCTYGYILHQAGVDVTAVCRTNFDIVKERGILIRSKLFGRCEYRPHPVKSAAEASNYGPFDYIVVATKALPGTAELIKDAVTPNHTAIVLAQNGIAIEEDYVELYPGNTIISGVVYLPVTEVEPGIVEMGPLEQFRIGTYPANASQLAKNQTQKLSDLWEAGGATAPVSDDIQPWRWLKLAVNTAWNPITALTLCDDANFLRSSSTSKSTIRRVMREVGRIATAAGYPDAVTEAAMDDDLQRPIDRLENGGKEPSMLTDIRERRPIEVDAILGNTMRIA